MEDYLLEEQQQRGLFCDTAIISREGEVTWAHSIVLSLFFPPFHEQLRSHPPGIKYVYTDLPHRVIKNQVNETYGAVLRYIASSQDAQDKLQTYRCNGDYYNGIIFREGCSALEIHMCFIAIFWPFFMTEPAEHSRGLHVIHTDLSPDEISYIVDRFYSLLMGPRCNEFCHDMEMVANIKHENHGNYTTNAKSSSENIVGVRTQSGDKSHGCLQCGKPFCTDLTRHLNTHTGEKAYDPSHTVTNVKCENRDDFTPSSQSSSGDVGEGYRNHHMITLTRKGRTECPECGKVFLAVSHLKIHMRIHTGEKPYKCSQCEKSFTAVSHLNAHMRIHTGEKPYQCSQCDQSFAQASALKAHMRTHTGEKPYGCSQCDKSFAQQSSLNYHMIIHTGETSYECLQCGQACANSTNLKIHMRTHTGERPYACSECDKSFTHKSALTRHMSSHTGEKSYGCLQCGKAFVDSSKLKIHMRTHTGEKPYECSLCDKSYSQSNDLKKHMRTHTGEKPYECSQCGKAFSQSSHLNSHMRTHTGEKPYECSLCDKSYSQSQDLTKHMEAHHMGETL